MRSEAIDSPQTEWRLRRGALFLRLIPILAFAVSGFSSVYRWFDDPAGRDGVDRVLFWATLAMGVVGAVLVVWLVRTRVRLVPAGLEVREIRTRLYPWAKIADVKLDRYSGNRSIQLVLRNGQVRALPTPTRGLRKPSDSTLRDAIETIRRFRPDVGSGADDDSWSTLDELLSDP